MCRAEYTATSELESCLLKFPYGSRTASRSHHVHVHLHIHVHIHVRAVCIYICIYVAPNVLKHHIAEPPLNTVSADTYS